MMVPRIPAYFQVCFLPHPHQRASETLKPSSSSSLKRKREDAAENEEEEACSDGSATPVGSTADFRSDCPLRLHRHYRLVVKEVAG